MQAKNIIIIIIIFWVKDRLPDNEINTENLRYRQAYGIDHPMNRYHGLGCRAYVGVYNIGYLGIGWSIIWLLLQPAADGRFVSHNNRLKVAVWL